MKITNIVDLETFRSQKKEEQRKDRQLSDDLNSAIRHLIQRMRERNPLKQTG